MRGIWNWAALAPAALVCAASAQPIDLSFRAEVGEKLRYHHTEQTQMIQGAMGQNVEVSWNLDSTFVLEVLSRDADVTKMQLTYEKIAGDAKFGDAAISVDTSDPASEKPDATERSIRDLIGKPITFTLTPEGIEDLTPPAAQPAPAHAQLIYGPLAGKEELPETLKMLLIVSTEKSSAEANETWVDTSEESIPQVATLSKARTFTIKEAKSDDVAIDYSTAISIKESEENIEASIKTAEVSGLIHWDPAKGVLKSVEGKSTIDMPIKTGPFEVTNILKSSVKTELVPSAS